LAILKYDISGMLFGKTAYYNFYAKDSSPPKAVRVELHKPMFSLNWKVVKYEEKEQQKN